MLRCIAIDDEELALELLEDNISKVPYLTLVSKFNNSLEAVKFIQEQPIDLVFLDIQMPGLSGLQLIQSILNKPMFILVTAYEKFALYGFELNVIDYLLKPVSFERFLKACNKAWEFYQLKNKKSDQQREESSYFFINVDYSLLKIIFADIVWIEALKDYIKIHLKSSSKPVVARLSMKSLEEQLPSSKFIRIQKSYIVSKDYITAVRKNSIFLGKLELPVGENYRDSLESFVNRTAE